VGDQEKGPGGRKKVRGNLMVRFGGGAECGEKMAFQHSKPDHKEKNLKKGTA